MANKKEYFVRLHIDVPCVIVSVIAESEEEAAKKAMGMDIRDAINQAILIDDYSIESSITIQQRKVGKT